MKLIDEKEVEEAANVYCCDVSSAIFGSNFAEQKLLPKMVEFSEWCERNYSSRVFPDGTVLWNLDGVNFITKQLLEQFINRDK